MADHLDLKRVRNGARLRDEDRTHRGNRDEHENHRRRDGPEDLERRVAVDVLRLVGVAAPTNLMIV